MTILAALVIVTGATSASAAPRNSEFYTDLLLSDLIVRGHILSVFNQGVPAHEFDPSWSVDAGYVGVTFVEIQVDEVIQGAWDKPELTFVIEEDSGMQYFVSHHLANNSADPADEIAVGLLFMPHFRGGTYRLQMADAAFIRVGDLWGCEGSVEAALSLNEIRDLVKPTTLSAVLTSSQAVAIAAIASYGRADLIDPNNRDNASTILILKTNVSKVLKGNIEPGERTIRCFGGGSYYPAWAGHGPLHIDTGVDYCMFLTEVDGQLTIIGGANGMYRVGEDGKLRHNDLPIPVSIPDLQEMIAK